MSELHQKYREEKDVAEKTGKGLQNGDNIELNIENVKVFQFMHLPK